MTHITNTLGPKHTSPYDNISVKDEELLYEGFDQGYVEGVKVGRKSVYDQSLLTTLKSAVKYKLDYYRRSRGQKR